MTSMDMGMVAADRVLQSSLTTPGMGMFSTKISSAAMVAIRGTLTMFFQFSFTRSPL